MARPKVPRHAPVLTGLELVGELDEAILADGRTQRDILAEASLSINLFNIWKRGECSPTLLSLASLAQVLGYRITLQPEEKSNA